MSLFEGVDRTRNHVKSKFDPSWWRPEINEVVIIRKDNGRCYETYTITIKSREHVAELENDPKIRKIERDMEMKAYIL